MIALPMTSYRFLVLRHEQALVEVHAEDGDHHSDSQDRSSGAHEEAEDQRQAPLPASRAIR